MHPLLKLQWCTKVRVRVEIVISTKYGEGQGGGVLKCVGGLMGVDYGEALMEGGRASLIICLL